MFHAIWQAISKMNMKEYGVMKYEKYEYISEKEWRN